MIASVMSFRVPEEKFRENDFGWTRLEVAHRLLSEMGIEATEVATMQVIPAGDYCEIRLQAK